MAKLTSAQRNALPSSDFAYPAERRFPIEDKAHAQNALARAAQSHDQAVQEHVAAAVRKRFPGLEVKDSH